MCGATHGHAFEATNDGGLIRPLGLAWSSSCMQGWRDYMEDRHFAVPSLQSGVWQDTAAFAVLDGHGGAQVAEFCLSRLPQAIAEGSPLEKDTALVNAFHKMDELLMGDDRAPAVPQLRGGCAAVVGLISNSEIVIAHAGDCRAVLCRQGETVALTEDHKPGNPSESKRIIAAGGYLTTGSNGDLRVCSDLNLSRAIGDLRFKNNPNLTHSEQIICSTPDVTFIPRTPADEFIVLACDGVWDVITNEAAVAFIRPRLMQCQPGDVDRMSTITSDLLQTCVSPNLSETNGLGGDNLTAMVVSLQVNSSQGAGGRMAR